MQKLFELNNLRCSYDKNYQEGVSRVVLEIEHLAIPRGKKIFIVGESGIGKSTILETPLCLATLHDLSFTIEKRNWT